VVRVEVHHHVAVVSVCPGDVAEFDLGPRGLGRAPDHLVQGTRVVAHSHLAGKLHHAVLIEDGTDEVVRFVAKKRSCGKHATVGDCSVMPYARSDDSVDGVMLSRNGLSIQRAAVCCFAPSTSSETKPYL
jgi:hypothetical protein